MLNLFCQKMPLSTMIRGLMERCFSPERLNSIFDRHTQRQYTHELLFSTTCDLMLNVVLRVHPSIHAAYQAKKKQMNVSSVALYDKLKGIEPGISAALVRETAMDLAQIQDDLGVAPQTWLPGYSIRVLDGNCLAASEKRLRVHQGVSGAPLPGKSLVVLDPQRRLLVNVFPCEDGHAQERSLFDQVIPTVQEKEIWIADRNFCTRGFLNGLHGRGAYALIRQHGQLPLKEISEWTAPITNESGQNVSEQLVLIEGCQYRRVRTMLTSPTRDGDMYIDLITDVPATVDAPTLAELYRNRWHLETAFQHLEAHLKSEIETLAYPRAALFGFCLAILAYNVFSMALSALDAVHQKPVSETISTYYVGHEISSTFLALLLLSDAQDWHFLAHNSTTEFAQWLLNTARHVDLEKYKKHSRGPKKPKPKVPYDPSQPHVSTQQLLVAKKKAGPGKKVGTR